MKHPATIIAKTGFILALALLVFTGCLTTAQPEFDASGFRRFANTKGESIAVIYGNPLTLPGNSALPAYDTIRVHLPTGKVVYMTPSIASSGRRYLTKDGRFAFHEDGDTCTLIDKGSIIFEGALSSQQAR